MKIILLFLASLFALPGFAELGSRDKVVFSDDGNATLYLPPICLKGDGNGKLVSCTDVVRGEFYSPLGTSNDSGESEYEDFDDYWDDTKEPGESDDHQWPEELADEKSRTNQLSDATINLLEKEVAPASEIVSQNLEQPVFDPIGLPEPTTVIGNVAAPDAISPDSTFGQSLDDLAQRINEAPKSPITQAATHASELAKDLYRDSFEGAANFFIDQAKQTLELGMDIAQWTDFSDYYEFSTGYQWGSVTERLTFTGRMLSGLGLIIGSGKAYRTVLEHLSKVWPQSDEYLRKLFTSSPKITKKVLQDIDDFLKYEKHPRSSTLEKENPELLKNLIPKMSRFSTEVDRGISQKLYRTLDQDALPIINKEGLHGPTFREIAKKNAPSNRSGEGSYWIHGDPKASQKEFMQGRDPKTKWVTLEVDYLPKKIDEFTLYPSARSPEDLVVVHKNMETLDESFGPHSIKEISP